MKHFLRSLTIALLFFALQPTVTLSQAPANDNCAGATVITSLPYHATQNTRLATPNASDPTLSCGDGGKGKTVWYKWTADTTSWVRFSTIGSTPSDYDLALGLFTGSCGSLTEVSCTDDSIQGTVRQSVLYYHVQLGTSYIIHIAEWNGGGPSGGVPTGGDLILDVHAIDAPPPPPPVVYGPKTGSVPNGAVVTTGTFSIFSIPRPVQEREVENETIVPLPPPAKINLTAKAPEGSNYKEDRLPQGVTNTKAVVLNNFLGYGSTAFFPPDPILAVGPNHVIAAVNTSMRIFDKSGTVLKTIDLQEWFTNVKNPAGYGDPQLLYDHYAHRWILAGYHDDNGTQHGTFLSVSDDDNPLGTWYNWFLPNTLGDSVTGLFPDHPQMGYDEQAIYIVTRDFGAVHSHLRIIEKSQLYANTAGAVSWTDFWGFREPQTLAAVDMLKPSIEFGSPGMHFLVNASPYSTGTYMTVWKITNPVSNPSITAVNVPVVQYVTAPNPNQPGGGNPLEGDGSQVRHMVIYRDSSLWIAHSIRNPINTLYSALHYVRINPYADTTLEDMAMGLNGYWHFYPALMVDAQDNVHITFSRSGTSEYAGAFISGRKPSDPPGLAPSTVLKPGVAHYDIGTRNRWGDYLGIGLDPVDTTAAWVQGMYASRANGWSTWIGKMKMGPLPGSFIAAEPQGLSFSIREVGYQGDTSSISISNNGLDPLSIDSLRLTDPSFILVNPPTLPASIPTFATITVKVSFNPQQAGDITGALHIYSNDAFNPTTSIGLVGKGFSIAAAQTGTVYSTKIPTGGDGRLYTVSALSGATTEVGLTGYDQIKGLRVHPTSHELYGVAPVGSNIQIIRINTSAGDAHPVFTVTGISNMKGMTFKGDTLIVGTFYPGQLYKINVSTGAKTLLSTPGISIGGLDINPITGELWASELISDGIYKIDIATGTPTLVGNTGIGTSTTDLAFDGFGNLFGVTGDYPAVNQLVFIDTTNGSGKIIGSMGINDVQSLAMDHATKFLTTVFNYPKGWNLVSAPIFVNDYATKSIFPTSISKAFTFQGSYVQKETLQRGAGYWLKFPAYTGITSLAPRDTTDTVDVNVKWNIVGSIANNIPASGVTSIPPNIIVSNFVGYSPTGGYSTGPFIEPTKAYWVRVNSVGKLVYASSSAVPKESPAEKSIAFLKTINNLTLRDKSGTSQTLYFGKQSGESASLERYSMPPPAPEAAFDARYSTGTMLVTHDAQPSGAVEFSISVQASKLPLTASWHVDNNPQIRYTLVRNSLTSKNLRLSEMKGDGSVSLSKQDISDLRLRVEQNVTPKEFSLAQNYPNPFNPTTIISYQVPVNSQITLKVFDVLGRVVTTLVDGVQDAGQYDKQFSTESIASGIYFYRMYAKPLDGNGPSYQSVRKMVFIK